MPEKKDRKGEVFQIVCPCCRSPLWVDAVSREVIQAEKPEKKKDSLDDLLQMERKRKDEFERKFEATAELEKKKLERAKEKFEKAILNVDKKEN